MGTQAAWSRDDPRRPINTYNLPDFCKVDVEGYEFEVLKGPVDAASRAVISS